MTNICLSGGALGADKKWGVLAEKAGHDVCHFTFGGHGAASWAKGLKIPQSELEKADPFLIKANQTLKRTFPTNGHFVDNLLRRNYWQVCDTQRVYAVSYLGKDGNVAGGTAWAVQMFLDRMETLVKPITGYQPPLYFYEMAANQWLIYEFEFGWKPISGQPPRPEGRWTGIGTRKLTVEAEEAMEALFA